MSAALRWLALTEEDLPAVDHIAGQLHPTLPERMEVFSEKIALFPPGCKKLARGAETVGYAVSHPWKRLSIPPLDAFLEKLPSDADCLYLHDIAIVPEARGQNAAGQCLDHLRAVARQYRLPHMACVSVYGSFVLWQRHGFQTIAGMELEDKLASYGAEAKYMTMDIKPLN